MKECYKKMENRIKSPEQILSDIPLKETGLIFKVVPFRVFFVPEILYILKSVVCNYSNRIEMYFFRSGSFLCGR